MIQKIIFSALIVLSLASCGNDDKNNSGSTETTENGGSPGTDNTGGTANTTTASSISTEEADLGLELISKSDCLTCHKVEDRIIGPSYSEVAAKYSVDSATINMLAQKIIKGGAGNWGEVAMTPHPQLSENEAKGMVKYVLSLKK